MTVAARSNAMQLHLGDDEIAAVNTLIESHGIAFGQRVVEFEEAFGDAVEAECAVAVSSGVAALHLALVVAGVGCGDDVVVPALSSLATANAPVRVGARAVFGDVDVKTGNITADAIAAVLTPATTAVVVVDQGGMPVDLDPIRALCVPLGIAVIENAADAVGAAYRGRPVGVGADIATWSFRGHELLTTGEGGMITTSRPEWAERIRGLREPGVTSPAGGDRSLLAPPDPHSEVEFDYRMTDLHAAVGLVQLGKLPAIIDRRRELAGQYQQALRYCLDVRCVEEPEWGRSNYQSFWMEIGKCNRRGRDRLLEALAATGLPGRLGAIAAHRHSAHTSGKTNALPVTDRLAGATLVLPLFHEMTSAELRRVVCVVGQE